MDPLPLPENASSSVMMSGTTRGSPTGMFGYKLQLFAEQTSPGAKRVFIAMEHATKDGKPKILKKCSLPLTGVEVVNYIVTELAVVEVTPEGLVFREIAEDTTVEQVQALTEPRLLVTAGGPQKMLA